MASFLRAATAVAAVLVAGHAGGQPFPAKPVEMVVHTAAGGGGDLFARAVADIAAREKLLPQPFIISNRGGGGGTIAFNYVAGKRADPYVVLAVPTTVFLTAPLRSGLDLGLDKFTPLGSLGTDMNALTVRADSPYATMKDLVEASRREPNTIVVGFGSIGGTGHYLAYQLEKLAGARIRIVPMKGAQAVLSVLGGHIHATTESLSEVTGHVEGKKMRVLGIPTAQRLPSAPAFPTMREQGYDIRSGLRRGFMAPAGVPKDVVPVYEAMLEKVSQTAEWKDFAARTQMETSYQNGAAFARYLAERQPELTQFIKDTGLVGQP